MHQTIFWFFCQYFYVHFLIYHSLMLKQSWHKADLSPNLVPRLCVCAVYLHSPYAFTERKRTTYCNTPVPWPLFITANTFVRIPSSSKGVHFFSPFVYCYWLDLVLAIKWILYPSMLKGERNTCNVCIRLTMWHIHITTLAIGTQHTFPLYYCWPNVAVNHVKRFSVDMWMKQRVPFLHCCCTTEHFTVVST